MLYLLRFRESLGGDDHQANYYLGYCGDDRLEERLLEHRQGRGAAITRAAMKRGGFELVGVMPGTRTDERRLKNCKNHKRLVPKFRHQTHLVEVLTTFTCPDFLQALAAQAIVNLKRPQHLPSGGHQIAWELVKAGYLKTGFDIDDWTKDIWGRPMQPVTNHYYEWNCQE